VDHLCCLALVPCLPCWVVDGFYASLRKKKMQQFEDSILTGSSMKANSMFGSTGGQSVDTNNSVFNSNFAPSASQLDANEVDPVAEADVYIAYGRDTQAEEILKEALRTQPDRHAVRVKLLEIYFTRKDAKSFERLASELYGMTSGEGDEWAQAASMGVSLDPNNPLYAGGRPTVDTGAILGATTQPLEELDPDALLANSLTNDMLESISIIDTVAGNQSNDSAATSEQSPAAELNDLDFDLQIPSSNDVAPKAAPLAEEHDSNAIDFGSIDFDLGGSDHELEFAAPTIEAVSAPEAESKQEDTNSLSFDSDVPELTVGGHAEGLDLANEDDSSHLADPAVAHEFDLSGIDLNLETSSEDAAANSSADNYNAEMATKLDLAVAYHEIGDKDGARELLNEVLEGGTPDQVSRAREMLTHLS